MRRLTAYCLFVAVIMLAGCAPRNADEGVQVGQILPNAELTTFAGEKVNVHDLRGQPVVINFWATWCEPCKEEIPMLQAAYENTSRTGFQLLAVTNESRSTVEEFVGSFGMSFPVVFDPGGRAGNRYRVQAIPTTFFLDSEGRILARHMGALDAQTLAGYLSRIMAAPDQPAPNDTPAPDDAPVKPEPDSSVG
ncbi:MAG: TlpA family protein disulfide reductase [Oscillochloris sp.]|nr:TlpA family protein disulfide reductase [Oscillochloris sp.]